MAQASGSIEELLSALEGAIAVRGDAVEVRDELALQGDVTDALVYSAVFGAPEVREAARWLIWATAQAVGLYPASIHELYLAAGRYEYDHATTPAINVRGMSYDLARTIIRTAQSRETSHFIFEIARSEMGYTGQSPAEFAAVMLAAGLREGYRGPLFIQGDHQQLSAKGYAKDPEAELAGLRQLIDDSLDAGFYNIDIDASTLVDLSRPTEAERQERNYRHTAELTAYIREREPAGVTVSVGGEIGEVGSQDSTPEDLDAFMQGFVPALREAAGDAPGISKISVQTGTSHGGVPLPDGTVAEVNLNLEALGQLSATARRQYGLGGAVQHGASTLPEEAFNQFAARGAVEVHLATAFQNIIYDHLPQGLKDEIYAHLAEHHADERKPEMTDAQFYYTTRKRGFGPFKEQFWNLPPEVKGTILEHLAERFGLLFDQLGVSGNADLVARYVRPVPVANTRSISKADLIHNNATPRIDVDPETYEVRADGELLTCDPATELPLAQRYFLF
jgi:fructose/tagatose bisphosphate aldolase